MINRLILFIFVASLISFPAFAGTNPSEPAQFNLTVEQLASMSDYDRNQYMAAFKNAQELKKGTPVALPEAVEQGINMLENVDVTGLSKKAEEIAGAIVSFCSTLGVGVEKFIYSRTGLLISVGVMWKMGMVGDFKDFVVMGFAILFFTWLIYMFNTNKTVLLKEYERNDKGKLIVTEQREVTMPRFNALFTYVGARLDDNKTQKPEEIGIYRLVGTIISTILLIIFVIAI